VSEQRWELLTHINALTDKPMIALSFVWLGLLILDFTQGLGPLLQTVANVIWALFVLDFAIEVVGSKLLRHEYRASWAKLAICVRDHARDFTGHISACGAGLLEEGLAMTRLVGAEEFDPWIELTSR
jgi:hypothetical protein